jgi:hypothetical protein
MIKQSGEKQTFETGAQRDSNKSKCRPDLLSPFAAERKGWICKHGADHYGDRNWEKGMPFSRVMQSIERHLMAYKQGQIDEDHLAQLGWNVDALLHFEEAIKGGFLPASLNDLPEYLRDKKPAVHQKSFSQFVEEDLARMIGVQIPQDPAWQPTPETSCPEKIERPSPKRLERSLSRNGFIPFTEQGCYRELQQTILKDMGCPSRVALVISLGTSFCKVRRPGESRPPIVYLSGPMRGIPKNNFPAFDLIRDRFLELGFDVISPADVDRSAGDTEKGGVDTYAVRDFHSLRFVKAVGRVAKGSCIAMLPGWGNSRGAKGEYFLAQWLGIPAVEAYTQFPVTDPIVRSH